MTYYVVVIRHTDGLDTVRCHDRCGDVSNIPSYKWVEEGGFHRVTWILITVSIIIFSLKNWDMASESNIHFLNST